MPKKPQYNLQRLLEIREQTREKAAQYLEECRHQLSIAENELLNRQQAVENCRRTLRYTSHQVTEKSRTRIKSGEMVSYLQRLTDLRDEEQKLLEAVEDQKNVVKRADQVVEKAFTALSEASKEVKVIEKHKEKWQEEQKINAERREQKTNDEIGAILYERLKTE